LINIFKFANSLVFKDKQILSTFYNVLNMSAKKSTQKFKSLRTIKQIWIYQRLKLHSVKLYRDMLFEQLNIYKEI